jgi:ATP-binding protein involved in chromosome partitioning
LQNEINKIIAVASGKGGVGKSTIAVNTALALSALNLKVGLLDADIYGPSQPSMLGTRGQHPAWQGSKLMPFTTHGIQSMSMGNLIDEYAPVIWRGPMLGKAMQQLLHDTTWGKLDYLIVDLPPGTGDVQISLCQKIPVNGALIVTTPQDLALLDVKRACEMFKKMSVPLLGVVENMSSYHCPKCGHESALFGEGGGSQLAQEYNMALFAKVPLHLSILNQAPDDDHAEFFKQIAKQLIKELP